jgi:hypothetical protein
MFWPAAAALPALRAAAVAALIPCRLGAPGCAFDQSCALRFLFSCVCSLYCVTLLNAPRSTWATLPSVLLSCQGDPI